MELMGIYKMLKKYLLRQKKKRRNIKGIKTSIGKIEHYKISKLLTDSSVFIVDANTIGSVVMCINSF